MIPVNAQRFVDWQQTSTEQVNWATKGIGQRVVQKRDEFFHNDRVTAGGQRRTKEEAVRI